MHTPAELLGPHGPFVDHVSGYAPRAAQQAMAEAVATAIEAYGTLVCEAGTGTGKTYAYLVPALLSGKKVIVSSGTKNLQDQLFHRDLPVVREALAMPIRVALLKGRANYLCVHRLALAEAEGRFTTREQVDELRAVSSWSRRTHSGDIAELGTLSERAAIWPLVTSTADNCLGQECPQFAECHVVKARRKAQEAEIVVVNHYLLFADMVLKEEGFGELLPSVEAFVIDEAHQLPEIAAQFFGITLSSRQVMELARDSVNEQLREAGDMDHIGEAAHALEYAVRDARLAFGAGLRRAPWHVVSSQPKVQGTMSRLRDSLDVLITRLELAAVRGKGLENCWKRAVTLRERMALLLEQENDDYVQWFETYSHSFALHLTPLEVGTTFSTHQERFKAAWIFTSATLAVGESFEHFCQGLGLHDVSTAQWDSPFDYRHNAVLYAPEGLPLPDDARYTRSVVDAALPLLAASGGRAFLLFTSHRALNEAAALLQDVLPYPLMIQGEAPRSELLARFRAAGNAVLLGAGSFWEGVDVRGEALSLVVIDKLPFASPGDPVLQARMASMRARGKEPFRNYQLPRAVIALKQGVGRLIRDVHDRGVLMLCDPRLLTKSYGKAFLSSLPPMARTRDLSRVEKFLAVTTTRAKDERVAS